MSDQSQGPNWWLASDGKWYPPELRSDPVTQPAPTATETAPAAPDATSTPSPAWLYHPLTVGAMLTCCFPIGLVVVWTSAFEKATKWVLTAVVGGLWALLLVASAVAPSEVEVDAVAPEEAPADAETPEVPDTTAPSTSTTEAPTTTTTSTTTSTTSPPPPTTTTSAPPPPPTSPELDAATLEEVFWLVVQPEVPYISRADAVELARGACQVFDEVGVDAGLIQIVGLTIQNDVPAEDIGVIVGAGVPAFCAEHQPALEAAWERLGA